MVLRETAIRVGMGTAPRAGAQIRDQFFQLEPAPFHFNGNEDATGERAHRQIKTFRDRAMFRPAGSQGDMPPQPAAFQDKPGRRRELAKVFAQQPRWFVPEKPIGRRVIRRRQQIARHAALLVDFEQTLLQAERKIFRFPIGQGRTDPRAGKRDSLPDRLAGSGESFLQPRFQFRLQIRIKTIPARYRLAAARWLALIPAHKFQL